MELSGKNVLVVGSGISGIGAVTLLEKVGAVAVLYDGNEKLVMEEVLSKFKMPPKAEMYFGDLNEDVRERVELVVISPGVPIDIPFLDYFKNKGVKIWGEVELAYNVAKGDVLAITGTNGKTTTTALLGEIMKDYFDESYVVGNIGTPYTGECLKMSDKAVTVAEISSFQLETIHSFHPRVSAVLNITPDHLNRHHTMECYIETKEKIALNQTEDEYIILNYDDPITRKTAQRVKAKAIFFSVEETLDEGLFLSGDKKTICYSDGTNVTEIVKVNEMNLLGIHNVQNVMAACGMAIAYKVPVDSIRETVKRFKAVEHRIEFVEEIDGVSYYNDSKGTNVDAAIKGIEAMTGPTLLIGGGYDKMSEYDEWILAFNGKVKYLVLIGQTADKIAACARKYGFNDIVFAETLKEAVDICHDRAVEGDSVLLSPACASWGMFDNYEQRGRLFKEYVRAL